MRMKRPVLTDADHGSCSREWDCGIENNLLRSRNVNNSNPFETLEMAPSYALKRAIKSYIIGASRHTMNCSIGEGKQRLLRASPPM